MTNFKKTSLKLHKKNQGKIEIQGKKEFQNIDNREKLSIAYSPGVGAVSSHLAKNNTISEAKKYTIKGNTIAVISDGSAVLGLGNIGPFGALPVMEGKALLFKSFANLDAYPIVLDTQDTEEIIRTIKNIAPTFGGINIEDISAPRCFEIEKRLNEELDIPVFHDDQHGTAVVILAGLINSQRLLKKENLKKEKIVINGAGASGLSTTKILHEYGFENIVLLDSRGIISKNRDSNSLNEYKKELIDKNIIISDIDGDLEKALQDTKIFIGLSVADVLKKEWIKNMKKDPIIFALANPNPEIKPELAKEMGAFIVATGRSDYENQINNVLVFPGILRGAVDNDVKSITMQMKINASLSIANYIAEKDLKPEFIIPDCLDKNIAIQVAKNICDLN